MNSATPSPLRFSSEAEATTFLSARLAEGRAGYVVNGSRGWIVATYLEGSAQVWAYYAADRAVCLPDW
jgi:hypothetical protein